MFRIFPSAHCTYKELIDLPNMLSIISHILSIPASTGYVERIFSRMANKWSENRNRCSVELITSELPRGLRVKLVLATKAEYA